LPAGTDEHGGRSSGVVLVAEACRPPFGRIPFAPVTFGRRFGNL
jgi:hypothetical protein